MVWYQPQVYHLPITACYKVLYLSYTTENAQYSFICLFMHMQSHTFCSFIIIPNSVVWPWSKFLFLFWLYIIKDKTEIKCSLWCYRENPLKAQLYIWQFTSMTLETSSKNVKWMSPARTISDYVLSNNTVLLGLYYVFYNGNYSILEWVPPYKF